MVITRGYSIGCSYLTFWISITCWRWFQIGVGTFVSEFPLAEAMKPSLIYKRTSNLARCTERLVEALTRPFVISSVRFGYVKRSIVMKFRNEVIFQLKRTLYYYCSWFVFIEFFCFKIAVIWKQYWPMSCNSRVL